MLQHLKICFVGAGAMAEAIVSGLLEQKRVKPGQLTVTNREDRFRLDELVFNFGIVAEDEQKYRAIHEADILILAMKPKDVPDALRQIVDYVRAEQLFISVVAGIKMCAIEKVLGEQICIVRTMPNTSAKVGQAVTGMCYNDYVSEQQIKLAKSIFESIGMVFMTTEDKLDAVTGLTGSGPAYVYAFVEAMIKGGIDVGFSEEQAKGLALQTLKGASEMLQQSKEEPHVLRQQVTSPNGTTAKGLHTLQLYKFEEAIRQCIQQATLRSQELGEQLQKE